MNLLLLKDAKEKERKKGLSKKAKRNCQKTIQAQKMKKKKSEKLLNF